MKKYEFPEVDGEWDYRVFPDDVEDDPNIFFHGTSASNFKSVVEEGFKTGPSLSSVSFSKLSSLALVYACDARKDVDAEGCIFVVRYPELNVQRVVVDHSMLHDFRSVRDIEIVGYSIVPSTYRNI